MKTTIATDYTGRLIVQPLKLQNMVMITSRDTMGQTVMMELTADQAGALVFGIEQALAATGAVPC